MPRGMSFERIGLTESMIDTYADIVWAMSNNVQVRRGDPIRLKDFARVQAERADLGMSDAQIAQALGLTRDQVMGIRVLTEVRRFDRRSYHRLQTLGRGNRWHPGRSVAPESRPGFDAHALALRESLRFDPAQVQRFLSEGGWKDDTLTQWLASRAAEVPSQTALAAEGLTIDYAQLQERAERLACGLHALGLGRGDVVAIQLPNLPEFVIAYLAVARLGAVLCTVHMPYREAEIRKLLAHGRARAFVCQSHAKDFSPASAVLAMRTELPALEHVIALGEPVEGAHAFETLAAGGEPLPEEVGPAPADPFLLLFTSGTSSSPKAVPLTYQATLGNARMGAPEHGMSAQDVVLSAAPFTHLFGLYSLHLALRVGATVRLLPAFSPPAMAQAIAAWRPTVLFCAPAHLAAMLKDGLLDDTDLASVRLVIASGSACPGALVEAVDAKLPNGRFTQLWGMTEMQAGLYTRPDDPVELVARSAGRPSPGTEARIVAPDGTVLGADQEGELQIRGSLLFPGYFDNDAANAEAFSADGWFRTGDLARCDAAGNVSITGRIKDVINRGGVKYNPRDIEDLLDAHPDVMQSAIVPLPDPVLGERACCVIVPRAGVAPTLEALCGYLLDHGVARNHLPERLECVDEMPLTPTRKIIKGQLIARLAVR